MERHTTKRIRNTFLIIILSVGIHALLLLPFFVGFSSWVEAEEEKDNKPDTQPIEEPPKTIPVMFEKPKPVPALQSPSTAAALEEKPTLIDQLDSLPEPIESIEEKIGPVSEPELPDSEAPLVEDTSIDESKPEQLSEQVRDETDETREELQENSAESHPLYINEESQEKGDVSPPEVLTAPINKPSPRVRRVRRAPRQVPRPTFPMRQHFADMAQQNAEDFFDRQGDKNIRPDEEEMRQLMYTKKSLSALNAEWYYKWRDMKRCIMHHAPTEEFEIVWTIRESGEVSSVNITHSSGNALLDNLIKQLISTMRFPPLSKSLATQGLKTHALKIKPEHWEGLQYGPGRLIPLWNS